MQQPGTPKMRDKRSAPQTVKINKNSLKKATYNIDGEELGSG